MSSSSNQPLSQIDQNVSLTKLQVPQSRLKPPTPCSMFKKPGAAHYVANPTAVKRSRLDLSDDALNEQGTRRRALMRRSKSVISTRGRAGFATGSPLKRSSSTLHGATKKCLASSLRSASTANNNAVYKVASMSSLALKPKAAISAPVTKAGKRPAWDLKGRMQDNEEALKDMRTHNTELTRSIDLYNERLCLLEMTNSKLTEEARTKETISIEKSNEVTKLESELKGKIAALLVAELENGTLKAQFASAGSEIDTLRQTCHSLEATIASLTVSQAGIKALLLATQDNFECSQKRNSDLEAVIETQKQEILSLQEQLLVKETKIREDETQRRQLHNTIQELKGSIRVFCRVRPFLPLDSGPPARFSFPDSDHHALDIVKRNGDESTDNGKNRGGKYSFTFDRVFPSVASQEEVFDEVSQLIQSALDGYNVCLFAYGQTGSGKTYTMEGPASVADEDALGIIPRAVSQIFVSIKGLEGRGWQYEMEASFLEIYNETIRDLLGNTHDDTKHDIKLADAKGSDVYVTNLIVEKITSEEQVLHLLRRAQNNRAVAATLCNEHSSRSHSVFRLRLIGRNDQRAESCQGMLNLVDLAGSERLKESRSEGERLKETKSINKSLSNLSTVITSLAQKAEHIPYRNSKLTHLLMNCLGGNSKTLMLVNVSPREDNINETVNSLRFATTVNQCNIGTAQRKVLR